MKQKKTFTFRFSENKDIIYEIMYAEQTEFTLEQQIGMESVFSERFNKAGYKAKDTLFFFMPEECMIVSDTAEEIPVYNKDSDLQVGNLYRQKSEGRSGISSGYRRYFFFCGADGAAGSIQGGNFNRGGSRYIRGKFRHMKMGHIRKFF